MHAIVCDLLPRDRKCTRSFAIFFQEIANARDRLRSSPKRSQMHAMVCDLLPRDRKCTQWFAIFSQEIANARDGLRISPRTSQSIPFIFRWFCGRNSSKTFQGIRKVADK